MKPREALLQMNEMYMHLIFKYNLSGGFGNLYDNVNMALKRLEELEKRATPMKVGGVKKVEHQNDIKSWGKDKEMYLCPNCHRVIAPFHTCDYEKSNNCDKCGQALDWSDDK